MLSHQSSVVRLGLIQRLATVTAEQFSAGWRGEHGQLAAQIPDLRRYHQNHALHHHDFADLPSLWQLDGLSELWFDSIEAMTAGLSSPSYLKLGHSPKILQMPGVVAGQQEILFGSDKINDGLSKAMIVVGRNLESSQEDFFKEWRKQVGGAANGFEGVVSASHIYISHREVIPPRIVAYEDLPVDVVTEIWFDDIGDRCDEMFSLVLRELEPAGSRMARHAVAFSVKPHVIVA